MRGRLFFYQKKQLSKQNIYAFLWVLVVRKDIVSPSPHYECYLQFLLYLQIWYPYRGKWQSHTQHMCSRISMINMQRILNERQAMITHLFLLTFLQR